MAGLLLLLATSALALVAAVALTRLLRPESALDGAVNLGVCASAVVVATVVVSGAAGVLERWVVVGLAAALALGASLAARHAGAPDLPRPRLGDLRRHPWTAALLALAALAVAWQALVALVLAPFAFDAISYHLTIATDWVRGGAIEPSELSLCCAYYPSSSEALFAWPLLLQGGEGIVDLAQLPFAALGAVAVAGIARSAGLANPAALAAAALFLVTPIVLTQLPTNYADVVVAAWALAALHSLTRFAASGEWRRLVVAGIAAGLLLGTKGTGVYWALVLAASALAVAVALVRRDRLAAPLGRRALAGFLCACVALGGYWYARNWIEQGNPAYPFHVEVAGVELFAGPFEVGDVLTPPQAGAGEPWPLPMLRSWAGDLDFWNQGGYSYEQRTGGLGPLWPWLGLPLAIAFAAVLARRRSVALVALVPVAAMLLVQPYEWWSRFTIPLAGVGAVAIAAAGAWAPRRLALAVRALALALALAGVGLASHAVDPAARAEPLVAGDLVRLAGKPYSERSVGAVFHPEYRFLEQVPEDATVVVDLEAPAVRFVYPLFGPRLEREVRPAGDGPPGDAWVVTERGRPLDARLAADERFRLAADVNGVRVWRPDG